MSRGPRSITEKHPRLYFGFLALSYPPPPAAALSLDSSNVCTAAQQYSAQSTHTIATAAVRGLFLGSLPFMYFLYSRTAGVQNTRRRGTPNTNYAQHQFIQLLHTDSSTQQTAHSTSLVCGTSSVGVLYSYTSYDDTTRQVWNSFSYVKWVSKLGVGCIIAM